MAIYVALLRGINVGTAKRIAMAQLRAILGDLGYADVITLLNSGNVVFDAARVGPAKHAADIAAAISARLKIEVPVIVKSAQEFCAIVAENPLDTTAADHSRLLVAFARTAKSLTTLKAISSLVHAPEQWVVGKSAGYLHCPNGILQSKAGGALLGKIGASVTCRNWATTLKLHAIVLDRNA